MTNTKMSRLLPLCLLAIFALNSCSSSLRARGTFAEIKVNEQPKFRAELLAVNDSVMIVKRATESTTFETYRHEQIRSAELEGISNGLWRPILILIGAFALIGLITALGDPYGADAIPFGIVGVVISVLSYVGFETTEPQTEYDWPLTAAERSKLQLYTRFPYGVTDEQLRTLRTNYGVDD
jgi:hypothetical protein